MNQERANCWLLYITLDQQRLRECEHRNKTMTTTKKDIDTLRNQNEGYKKQLQDGTLSEELKNDTRNWIASNNRLIEEFTAQITEQQKQITEKEKRITAQITEQEKRMSFDKQIILEQITLERTKNQGKSAASTDSLSFSSIQIFTFLALPFLSMISHNWLRPLSSPKARP